MKRIALYGLVLFSLLLTASRSNAQSVTVVQTPATVCRNVSSCTLTFPNAVAAGNAIFFATDFNAPLAWVKDNQGNMYTPSGAPTTSFCSGSCGQAAFVATGVKGGALSITAMGSAASSYMEMYAFEIVGGTVDSAASSTGAAGSIFVPLTAAVGGDVLVAVVISGNTASLGSGFTLGSNLGGNLSEWETVPNAGAVDVLASSNRSWSLQAALFRPAGPPLVFNLAAALHWDDGTPIVGSVVVEQEISTTSTTTSKQSLGQFPINWSGTASGSVTVNPALPLVFFFVLLDTNGVTLNQMTLSGNLATLESLPKSFSPTVVLAKSGAILKSFSF